jgi:hypothetical protein
MTPYIDRTKENTMKAVDTLFLHMHKHPYLRKHFYNIKKLKVNHRITDSMIIDLFFSYRKYNNLLKQEKLNLIDFHSFEKMDDAISRIIKNNNVNKVIKSLFSKKYMYLLNKKNTLMISNLIDAGIHRSDLVPYLSKMAAMKNTSDLTTAMATASSELIDYGVANILNLIKKHNLNVDVVFINQDTKDLILKINDYKASKILGSSAWCISYNASYFKSYTGLKGKHNILANQFFFYRFSKPSTDPLSLIGVTISGDKVLFAANKEDRAISTNHDLCKIVTGFNVDKFHNEFYLLDSFIKKLKGNDIQSLEYFISNIKTLNNETLNLQSLVKISHCLDRFLSKGLKRKSNNFYQNLLLSTLDKSLPVPSELISLLEIKDIGSLIKMHHLGYHVQSKKLNIIIK